MTRQLNKMSLSEAFCIFDLTSGCSITKEIIMKKFHELALIHHPDKGGDARRLSKIVEAKEVLMREFDSIVTKTIDADGKPVKSVGATFIDFLKVADTKNIANPFTVYQKGKSRRKE